MSGAENSLTHLLAEILDEQASLKTPAANFSHWHESEHSEPLLAKHYKKLIPLSKPEPGEQYAFEVNLDQCTGCKACVAACHSLNGLDDDESWRDVGELLGAEGDMPYLQTITSACHHCEQPACADGCPVLAYDKDPDTGIVRHLDDQCIGCSYCIMKCPYDVPKFNKSRGIVRKCDMCHDRLAEGEAPACVQACPSEAISIRLVDEGRRPEPGERLVPSAFPSDYTIPTTRYVSSRPIPLTAQSADVGRSRLDTSHAPLAWMLVLTQMGAGIYVFGALAAVPSEAKLTASTAAAAVTFLGLTLSLFHLGQPLKAWRAFLGWRRSWLSREIIAFGLFGNAALLPVIAGLSTDDNLWISLAMALAASAGMIAVTCSAMVYVDTKRPFWSWNRVSAQFIGTATVLGSGVVSLAMPMLGLVSSFAAAGLLCLEIRSQYRNLTDSKSLQHRSARVVEGSLRNQTISRRIFLCLAAMLFLIGSVFSISSALLIAVGCAFTALVIERHQFFTASSGPTMTAN